MRGVVRGDGTKYISVKVAAKMNGVSQSQMRRCLQSGRPTHGYYFRYSGDDTENKFKYECVCDMCGAAFIAYSKHAKYCPPCRSIRAKDKDRELRETAKRKRSSKVIVDSYLPVHPIDRYDGRGTGFHGI